MVANMTPHFHRRAHCFCTSALDDRLVSEAADLTWFPWIGCSYLAAPETDRLLVIGESHYIGNDPALDFEKAKVDHHGEPYVTRDKINEHLVNDDRLNRTYYNLARVLLGEKQDRRVELAKRIAFVNIVQRVLRLQTGERPGPQDFKDGWKAILGAVQLLRPAYCLLIGVSAMNFFPAAKATCGVRFEAIGTPTKIGKVWVRTSAIFDHERKIKVVAMAHLGLPVSWRAWRAYLLQQYPELRRCVD